MLADTTDMASVADATDAVDTTILAQVAEAIIDSGFSLSSFIYLENVVMNDLLVRFLYLFPPTAAITDTILSQANGRFAIDAFDMLTNELIAADSKVIVPQLKLELQFQGLTNILNNSPLFDGVPDLIQAIGTLDKEYATNFVYFVLLNLATASLPLYELVGVSDVSYGRSLANTATVQAAIIVLDQVFWIDYNDYTGQSVWDQ